MGHFDIPLFVHDTVPAGVKEMKRLKEEISYSFQKTPTGGRLVIRACDPEAMAAIHRFLRFQIEEHERGDPTEIH